MSKLNNVIVIGRKARDKEPDRKGSLSANKVIRTSPGELTFFPDELNTPLMASERPVGHQQKTDLDCES